MLQLNDLNSLFPFGFAVDTRCRISYLGCSLQKIIPHAKVGMEAREVFSLLKPSNLDWRFDSLRNLRGSLFLIETTNEQKKIILRGQLFSGDKEIQALVSPWLTDPEELQLLDLQLRDFAIHDPVNDFLQIVQSHSLATRDLELAAQSILSKSKEVQRSESQLKVLIDNMSSGILVENRDGKVTHANQVFANIFAGGVNASLLVGADCKESAEAVKNLFKDPEHFLSRIRVLVAERTSVKGEEIELQNGRILERDFIPLIQESRVTGYLWSYKDISKIKEAELKAIEASEEKSRFLATMSHEIRTPLNGVIGMSSLLLDTPLSRDQKEIVSSISNSGETLLTIVNDILDFSKIEAGKLDLEKIEFDLTTYCKEALKIYSYSAEKKNILLEDDIAYLDYFVVGDEGRFGQILSNLVSNAIKFTKKGKVSVCLRSKESSGETKVILSVTDTGIGIPKESQERVFEAFTQVQNVNARQYGGTGLGLSISKRLVQMMKGSIRFESEVGKGTTFFVEIPFVRGSRRRDMIADKYESSRFTALPERIIGARILVAEDNPTNQKVIGRMLSRLGMNSHLVANGNEVIDSLRNGQYDLILMDCQMPEMDGYQATKVIRGSDTLPNSIPIVALTANAIKGAEQKCFESGMNAYLVKPIKLHDLISCLEKNLTNVTKKYIDKEALEQFEELQMEGKPNILIETIDSFSKTSVEKVSSIVEAAAKGQHDVISKEAHSLKSSAYVLGAQQLAAICLLLEDIKKLQDEAGLPDLIERLSSVYLASFEELQEIRSRELEKDKFRSA